MSKRKRAVTATLYARAKCQHCAWKRAASNNRERHLARQNAAIHAQRWQHSVTWTERRVLLGWKADADML
jgi:hypothetical protein